MKVVVVGGSATGMGVVAKLKRQQPNAEIIVFQEMEYVSLGSCGIPYFIGNNFSDAENMIARTVEKFRETGVKVFNNTKVYNVDFETKTVYGKNGNQKISETYDKLVIASGSRPFIPNNFDMNIKNVFSVKSKEDAINIKEATKNAKNVVIIGGGLIGLEVAENIKELSKNVTIIERGSRVIENLFDEEFSIEVEKELERKEVKLFKETEVKNLISENGAIKKVELSNGQIFDCDLLIISIGVLPNTDFIDSSKIKKNNRGAIIVDSRCQSSLENVYAGGDCVETRGFIFGNQTSAPLATTANKHVKVIVDQLCGIDTEFAGTLNTAMVKIFDLELARSGENKNTINQFTNAREILIKDKDHTNYVSNQKDLWLKILVDNKTDEIINVQIMGQNKSIMRIYGLISLMWSRQKVDAILEQIDYPYAPPFSRSVDIIHIALSKLVK
ncbi:FAD-dependent oxidoreductase [Mesoplasma photuris]|uniref:FAD-dependent oxidoreductase n=1 Tax=Mesoplasma photuris TaxID=217731 RepID=UPI0004E22A4F|nr:FAD-dependent oxidoreductase [Mesoplasma photuris]